jgi:hypothetical protein
MVAAARSGAAFRRRQLRKGLGRLLARPQAQQDGLPLLLLDTLATTPAS